LEQLPPATAKAKEDIGPGEEWIISQLRSAGHSTILKAYKLRIGLSETNILPKMLKARRYHRTLPNKMPRNEKTKKKLLVTGPHTLNPMGTTKNVINFLHGSGRLQRLGI
jgi:hypothetical protein